MGRLVSIAAVTLASAGFSVWLVDLARRQWFVTDEWSYLSMSSGSSVGWLFRPHNEHTIVLTKLWFQLLLATVGMRHYALYALPLVATHFLVVAAIYRLAWSSTGSRTLATATAFASLAMGAGWGTLTWAGQFQVTGAVAAGLFAIVLAVEGSDRILVPAAIVVAIFGTLSSSSFLAFAGAASLTIGLRRRKFVPAVILLGTPVAWSLISKAIWHPAYKYAATSAGQVLRDGPSFAYAVIDTAITQTFRTGGLTPAVLVALFIGALSSMRSDIQVRAVASVLVIECLLLALFFSIGIMVIGRLNQGAELSASGGYSYMLLATLFPLAAALLGHVASSRPATVIIAALFTLLALMGVTTLADEARALSSWKLEGQRLTQTAAAELAGHPVTYMDEIPVPETAPGVTQRQLKVWEKEGKIDARIAGPLEVAQISLNTQWRIEAASGVGHLCRTVAAGASTLVQPHGDTLLLRSGTDWANVDLTYPGLTARRRFVVSPGLWSLESVATRPATLIASGRNVQICTRT